MYRKVGIVNILSVVNSFNFFDSFSNTFFNSDIGQQALSQLDNLLVGIESYQNSTKIDFWVNETNSYVTSLIEKIKKFEPCSDEQKSIQRQGCAIPGI